MSEYISSKVAVLDLPPCTQGEDYLYPFTYVDPDTLVGIDVTGWTYKMEIRKSYDEAVSATATVTATTPASGEHKITLAKAVTATLSPGRYRYDIFYTDSTPRRIPMVRGHFFVEPRITAE